MKFRLIALGVVTIVILLSIGAWIYLRFFFKIDLPPGLAESVGQKVAQVESRLANLEQASVIVNYDEKDRIWLTGQFEKDNRKFSIGQLTTALAAIQVKGPAFIARVTTSPGSGMAGLLDHASTPNTQLEKEIRDALISAGFTVPTALRIGIGEQVDSSKPKASAVPP